MKTANNLSIKTNKHLKNDELLALRGGGELTWDGECAIYYNGDYQGLETMTGLEGGSAAEIDLSCASEKGTGYTCFCNYID